MSLHKSHLHAICLLAKGRAWPLLSIMLTMLLGSKFKAHPIRKDGTKDSVDEHKTALERENLSFPAGQSLVNFSLWFDSGRKFLVWYDAGRSPKYFVGKLPLDKFHGLEITHRPCMLSYKAPLKFIELMYNQYGLNICLYKFFIFFI